MSYENPTVFTPQQQGGQGRRENPAFALIQQQIAQNQAKKQERQAAAAKEELARKKKEGKIFDAGTTRNMENLEKLNISVSQKKGLQDKYRTRMENLRSEINAQRKANPNMSESEISKIYEDAMLEVSAATKGLALLAKVNAEKDALLKSGDKIIGENRMFDALTPNGENFETEYKDGEQYFKFANPPNEDGEVTYEIYSTTDMQNKLMQPDGFFPSAKTFNAKPDENDPAYAIYEFTQDEEKMKPFTRSDGSIDRKKLDKFMISEGLLSGFNDEGIAKQYYYGMHPEMKQNDISKGRGPMFEQDAWWYSTLDDPPSGQAGEVYTEILDFYLPPERRPSSGKKEKGEKSEDKSHLDIINEKAATNKLRKQLEAKGLSEKEIDAEIAKYWEKARSKQSDSEKFKKLKEEADARKTTPKKTISKKGKTEVTEESTPVVVEEEEKEKTGLVNTWGFKPAPPSMREKLYNR